MEIMPVEVYSQASNMAVIKPPGRRFPGSVIQGDSLKLLAGTAQYVALQISQITDDEELVYAANDLSETLRERLQHYESVLREHGIELPY